MRPEAPNYDVYLDPDEEPTIPEARQTLIGLTLYRRLAELESTATEYDVDEVIASIKEQFQCDT